MDRLDVRLRKHEETLEDETAFIIWININGTSFEYLSSSKTAMTPTQAYSYVCMTSSD